MFNDRFVNTIVSTDTSRRTTSISQHRPRVCAYCETSQSTTWRRSPSGESWCNTCSLRNTRKLRKARQGRPSSSAINRGSRSPTSRSLLSLTHAPTTGTDMLFVTSYDSSNNIHVASAQEEAESSFRPGEHDHLQLNKTISRNIFHSSRNPDPVIENLNSLTPCSRQDIVITRGFVNYQTSHAFPGLETDVSSGSEINPQLQPVQHNTDAITSLDIQACAQPNQIDAFAHQPSSSSQYHPELERQYQPRHSLVPESFQPEPLQPLARGFPPDSYNTFSIRSPEQCSSTSTQDSLACGQMVNSSNTHYHDDGNIHMENLTDLIHRNSPYYLYNTRIRDNPAHILSRGLHSFYRRTASVHQQALRRGSSLFVGTETFIYNEAGEDIMVMAYSLLRENYQDITSPSSNSESMTIDEAAAHDLDFNYTTARVVTFPHLTSLDDWLNGQKLVQNLNSEREKSAIWDLTRVPGGSHLSDSRTYRWLKRYFRHGHTSIELRRYTVVASGSDQHPLPEFYGLLVNVLYAREADRFEIFKALEPRIQEKCISMCQAWFISVLDEAGKILTKESQLRHLRANQTYMRRCMQIYRDGYRKVNFDEPPHHCQGSLDCLSHIRPTFNTILGQAQEALEKLFSPTENLLHFISGTQFTYPTPEHIGYTRIMGDALFNLYCSYLLLNDEQRAQYRALTQPRLVDARFELHQHTQSRLIWNYLPVVVEEAATSKLNRAFADAATSYIPPLWVA